MRLADYVAARSPGYRGGVLVGRLETTLGGPQVHQPAVAVSMPPTGRWRAQDIRL